MNDLLVPTDSVLRRHFEQLAASRGLPPMPEDSVLRRHYLQRLAVVLAPAETPPAARAPAAERPAARAAQEPARPTPPRREPVAAAAAPEPTSWFGRLLRKLGGG